MLQKRASHGDLEGVDREKKKLAWKAFTQDTEARRFQWYPVFSRMLIGKWYVHTGSVGLVEICRLRPQSGRHG